MRWTTVMSLLAGVVFVCGCQPRDVAFELRFDDAATLASSRAVLVRVHEGTTCNGALRHADVFDPSNPGAAAVPPRLSAGTFSFFAEARSASCEIVAQVCVTRDLPLDDDTLELRLPNVAGGQACPAGQCMSGRCIDDVPPDAGPPDAGPPDANFDAGTDSGVMCGDDDECPGGRCRDGICCSGCWDGTRCLPGRGSTACGGGGELCVACGASETCGGSGCVDGAPISLALSTSASFLRIGGEIWSAGENEFGQRGELERATPNVFVRQIAPQAFLKVGAASIATCGIDTDGALYCWGRNGPGLLGNGSGDIAREERTPQRIGSESWREVDGGNQHICAIREDARLFCWGTNADSQLGVPPPTRRTPTEVMGGHRWDAVSAGDRHTCGIRDDGALFCWGSADDGRLGVEDPVSDPTPVRVGTETGWTAVSAGVDHTCGVREGELYCWGEESFGRLGNGYNSAEASSVFTPMRIGSATDWTDVAGGSFHTCALRNREVFCWGVAARGATGLPMDQTTPTAVTPGYDLLAVGWTHTCAVGVDGPAVDRFRCWGENNHGQVGTGSDENATEPANPTFDPPL